MKEADPGEGGQARNRCFITAAREFEPADEDVSEPYSILTKSLLEGLDPSREPQRWVTNYSLVDFLNQHLKGVPQRPTSTNFGEPINLTRTGEVEAAKSSSETGEGICPYKGLEFFDCNKEFIKAEKKQKQLSLLKMSRWLVIPVFVFFFIVEPILRQRKIEKFREAILMEGKGTRIQVEYLVKGCEKKE